MVGDQGGAEEVFKVPGEGRVVVAGEQVQEAPLEVSPHPHRPPDVALGLDAPEEEHVLK